MKPLTLKCDMWLNKITYLLTYLIELTSSINLTHRKGPVRLCAITEPIEQQLVRFRSIDYAGYLILKNLPNVAT